MRRATGARIDAEGLAVRSAEGPVFTGLDLAVAPGSLTAVRAGSGGGRTALLLTLSGRMRPSGGQLAVDGHPLPRAARRVRGIASLALCPGVNDLDDRLTVGEHLTERLLLRLRPAPRAARAEALAAAGLDGLDTGRRTGALTAAQRRRLGVALALLDEPRLILVDEADTGLDAAEQEAFWAVLRDVADAGTTTVAACADAERAAGLADVVELHPGRAGGAAAPAAERGTGRHARAEEAA